MARFKYHERDPETVRDRANQQTGGYDKIIKDTEFFKPKEGENNIRILPPTWNLKEWSDNWAIEVWLHRDIGPDKATYLCLDKMNKGKCPICEARLDARGDDEIRALKPKTSMLAYIINRDDEKAGPVVWALSNRFEQDICLRMQDKRTGEVLAIDHPDNGYDISFTRTGTGIKTRYAGIDIARRPSPLADRERDQDKWLDFIQDSPLPDLLDFKTYDYLSQVYAGKRSAKESADDADDKPTRSSRDRDRDDDKPSRSRSSRDADEEEDRRGSSRSRDRGEPDEKEDRRSARSSRETDDDNRAAKPSRDRDDDDRGSRRGRDRDEEPPAREERSRSRRDEPEDDPPARSTRPQSTRQAARDEEPDRGRERPHRARNDDDDEIPSKGSRSAPKQEDEPDPDDEPRGARAARGKESLNRLKPKD